MRLATDLLARPDHLPVVPLVQALRASDNRHDDWWALHDPGGAASVASAHQLVPNDDGADLFVVPLDWYWVRGPSWASRSDRRLQEVLQSSIDEAVGRPVVFFSGDRSGDRVDLDGAIVFREGARRSRMGPRDRAMPAFCDDLTSMYLDGKISIRSRRSEPTVGFCGLARHRGSLADRARELAALGAVTLRERRTDRSSFLGERLRAECLDTLERHQDVKTEFLVRDSSVYFGATDVDEVRRQYVDNMVDCDYTLCVRGSGNYSYRLYEALCMGRVPVVVDTDLALPASDLVAWQDLTVWVQEDQVASIGDLIAADHDSISNDDFVERQHELRRLWCDHLSARSWLGNLHRHIDSGNHSAGELPHT